MRPRAVARLAADIVGAAVDRGETSGFAVMSVVATALGGELVGRYDLLPVVRLPDGLEVELLRGWGNLGEVVSVVGDDRGEVQAIGHAEMAAVCSVCGEALNAGWSVGGCVSHGPCEDCAEVWHD